MTTSPAIELTGLTKRYGGTVALDDVDLSFPAGVLTCLLGRNGAGKTTIFSTVMGLSLPTSGEVRIGGTGVRSREIHVVRRSVGFMAQEPVLYEHLTGREFLRFIGELYGVEYDVSERLDERLARLEMADVADAAIRTYSAGMKKKVALLASILHEPRFLVLDEPFVSLDVVGARVLRETMKDYRDRGRVVVFSTHVMELAEGLADRIAVLHEGRLRFVGTVPELRATFAADPHESLEHVFLRITDDRSQSLHPGRVP